MDESNDIDMDDVDDDDIEMVDFEGINGVLDRRSIVVGPLEERFADLERIITPTMIRHSIPAQLNVILRCYPVSNMPGNRRPEVENGGKIILPPSILQHLTQMNVSYPMMFQLMNPNIEPEEPSTHCGVLEFIADSNRCYVPTWMMENLRLQPGDTARIQNVTLPVANFVKFEPQSVDFLDITNPKAILESALRGYACLTVGDIITVMYNSRAYKFLILETKPGSAVNIFECDMDVEFAAPVGYVEPEREVKKEDNPPSAVPEKFVAFAGTGNRLDGKDVVHNPGQERPNTPARRGIPVYDFEPFNIKFTRDFSYFIEKKEKSQQKKADSSFIPFSGTGFSLK